MPEYTVNDYPAAGSSLLKPNRSFQSHEHIFSNPWMFSVLSSCWIFNLQLFLYLMIDDSSTNKHFICILDQDENERGLIWPAVFLQGNLWSWREMVKHWEPKANVQKKDDSAASRDKEYRAAYRSLTSNCLAIQRCFGVDSGSTMYCHEKMGH